VDETALPPVHSLFAQRTAFRSTGGVCINPEAAQIFYLTRAEKSRKLQIAIEEAGGKVPIFAGT
jgi:4-hydroxy-tetrahydrodipicolinate synthase